MALKTEFKQVVMSEANLIDFLNQRDNFTDISYTVKLYLFLKTSYEEGRINSPKFQSVYKQFYGMNRWTTADFQSAYFKVMQNYKQARPTEELKDLIKSICNKLDQTGTIQFSFISKLLNLMDDKQYPIYDQYVVSAFSWKNVVKTGDTVGVYYDKYKHIINEYNTLLLIDDVRKVINLLRTQISPQSDKNELSDMRLLDIIMWQIGKNRIIN